MTAITTAFLFISTILVSTIGTARCDSRQLANEKFEGVPVWTSSYDASWGSTAYCLSGNNGHKGRCIEIIRGAQGSSVSVLRYSVPQNTDITLSVYIKCPSYSGKYFAETAYKQGDHSAEDFETNSGTWHGINRFSNDGTNGNGSAWTRYTVTVNTGSNTQISVGYRLGAVGCTGPIVAWDSFEIQ